MLANVENQPQIAADSVTPYLASVTPQPAKRNPFTSNPAIPWDSIRSEWEKGATSVTLASQFGVTESAIRMRATRYAWARTATDKVKKRTVKSIKRIVAQRVKEMTPEIMRRADAAIRECVETSVTGARKLVVTATERIEGASDRDLSSISTSLRTGVTVWREALGLGSASEGGGNVTIACHSVHMGVEEPQVVQEAPAVDV